MFGMFGMGGGGTFDSNYRCYPVSFLDKVDAENGDKVFLPSSALDRLGESPFEHIQEAHGCSHCCAWHCTSAGCIHRCFKGAVHAVLSHTRPLL